MIAALAEQAKTAIAGGRLTDAVPPLRALACAMPATLGIVRLLASAELALGALENTAQRHRWSLCIAPDDLTLIRDALSLPPEAGIPETTIRRLLVVEPEVARGYAVLGASRPRPGLDSSSTQLRRAVVLAPSVSAYRSLAAGRALSSGASDRAIRLARQALLLDPGNAEGFLVLAEQVRSDGRAEDALPPAQRALILRRDDPAAWVTTAIVNHRLARFDAAQEAITAATVLRPRNAGYAARAATLLPQIVRSTDEIEVLRDRIEALVKQDGFTPIVDPLHEVGTVPFALAYHGVNDRDLLMDLCGFYRRVCPSLSVTAPHLDRESTGRRRVAFVSEFFRNHSVFNMTEGHLRHLDRRQIDVTIVQIGSLPHEINASISKFADRVITVPSDLRTVRSTLIDLRLDVLVFADIGMTPMSYFLAFARMAKLQIVLPGHPVTTGVDTVDVFFTSDWMEPENCAEHYSETPHRVDGLPMAYSEERIAHTPVDRAAFGLAEDQSLYLCGQMLFKIHPEFDRVIGDVLERDPNGTVVLFDAPGDFKGMRAPLLQRLEQSNRDRPAVLDRLRFLPRLPLDRYIGLMKTADVVLDTMHFSGGNTTMQSLALGRPLVALPTSMMRGRVAMAPLHAMGMEAELLVGSKSAYVERVVQIATDKDLAADLGSRLASAAPRLIDADTAAQSLSKLILDGRATG